MKQLLYISLCSLLLFAFSCDSGKNETQKTEVKPEKRLEIDISKADKIVDREHVRKNHTVRVDKVIPQEAGAYVQGIIHHKSNFYVSTGHYNASTLRKLDAGSGETLRKVPIPSGYFAEGIAMIGNRIYQLTWRSGVCLVWDAETFEIVSNLTYKGEGWGLTTDGESLIFSNGTNQINFLDPADMSIRRIIYAFEGTKKVDDLNELEYIDGEIYANIFMSDEAVRIDPKTGEVLGRIDLSPLRKQLRPEDEVEVINGIAYDSASNKMYATGKNWPYIFEISLIEK